MATTKIIIRKGRINEQGLTPIFVKYTHEQKSILFATGQRIDPKHFDPKGRAKKSLPGFIKFNNLLEIKKREIDDIRLDIQMAKENPTVDAVKEKYRESHTKKSNERSQSALAYWPAFMHHKEKHTRIKYDTMRQYKGLLKNLQDFEIHLKRQFTFRSFDQDWYLEYVDYLYNVKSCNPNSVGNKIKMLKTFLAFALKQKLSSNTAFKDYAKPTNPTTIVTITTEQLDHLLNLDLADNPKLCAARDLFVLGASTALRFSDYNRLTEANIRKDHIVINTEKTSETVYIPLNKYSKEILRRNPNGLPKFDNGQLNACLKEVGERGEFNEIVEVTRFPKGVKVVEHKKLFQLLTTHAARRIFITLSLSKGMIPSDIMRISGHKDMRSFQRYINVSEKRLQEEVAKAWGT